MIKCFYEELDAYAVGLENFISKYQLPSRWFEDPDHVAIKCADSDDFEAKLEAFKPVSSLISYVEINARRLATVRLLKRIAVGSLAEVELLEIIEPRPEKVGKDLVGFEHMEFVYPNFPKARRVLNQQGVKNKLETNKGHDWIKVVINEQGQELKLNNRALNKIVYEEIQQGEATIFYRG